METNKLELEIIVKGEIVESNFGEFHLAIDKQLGSIFTDLETDAHFGQAEKDVKTLKKVEAVFIERKALALEQMESVNALFSDIDTTNGKVREARLDLERKIKTKKAEVKNAIIDASVGMITEATREDYRGQILAAIKGKSNLMKIKEAAEKCAVYIEERHEKNRGIIAKVIDEHGAGIVPDASKLLDMVESDLVDQLTRRVELAKERAETKRLEAEAIKAKKELEALKGKEAVDNAPKTAAKAPPEPALTPQEQKGSTIGAIPVGTPKPNLEPISAEDEFEMFRKLALGAFGCVKQSAESFEHEQNIELVTGFRKAVNAAWKKMIEGARV